MPMSLAVSFQRFCGTPIRTFSILIFSLKYFNKPIEISCLEASCDLEPLAKTRSGGHSSLSSKYYELLVSSRNDPFK